MKKMISLVALSATAVTCSAQSAPPVQEITKQIIRSVTNYANAISCPGIRVEPKQIAALTPYKSIDDRADARYAVLWSGDIGCAGGSGTEATHVAVVNVSAGDSFVVDPALSSPIVEFSSPVRFVERIVGNTRDSLILEGKEHSDKDPNCCPSIPVRFTMKPDEKGNWKVTEKRALTKR